MKVQCGFFISVEVHGSTGSPRTETWEQVVFSLRDLTRYKPPPLKSHQQVGANQKTQQLMNEPLNV